MSTIDSAGRSSANQSQGNSAIAPAAVEQVDRKKFDVLKIYEDADKVKKQSILTGGLDTGIDFGKFIIDTNIGTTSSTT
jgi:hypothetical protein